MTDEKQTKTLNEKLREIITKNRPKLGLNSIKTYVSTLSSFYKKMNCDNIDCFTKNIKEVIHSLKDIESNRRKTLLSALYILTGENDYKLLMLSDCKVVNDNYKQQKTTIEEKQNWVTMDEIQAKYNEYLQEVEPMLNNKISINEKQIINFFILALMSGVAGIPPRRSLDYADMKIRNYNKDIDNFYENGKFTFNEYKTFKQYGRVVLDVKLLAPQLNTLIKKWIKINKTDYLLYSSNNHKLSNTQLYQYNNKIWNGKSVSCNIYRHVYLTEFYKIPRTYMQMDEMSKFMGHSINQSMLYVKNDVEPKTE
jgi:hypothetical protein